MGCQTSMTCKWPTGGVPIRHCNTTGSIALQPTGKDEVGCRANKFGNHGTDPKPSLLINTDSFNVECVSLCAFEQH